MKRILITGGAGFVGSSLALLFKRHYPNLAVVCLDNLSRRGSELNLPRLKKHGISFVHGDVRNPEDISKIDKVDWLIECSAEPSVHAGFGESPSYLINTNLIGLINCLEYLRIKGGSLIFLSTSRVYPIAALRQLPLEVQQHRYRLKSFTSQGIANEGINESFPMHGARSLYGATKLAAELLIQEYHEMYQMPAIINRCGVLCGPWQMGKVDQGFMALWVANHFFGLPLKYMGFGGSGFQVRDVLHVQDLFRLLVMQMNNPNCEIMNVGGGFANSVSLKELTHVVEECVGKKINIASDPDTRPADMPYYVTDISNVNQKTKWQPEITVPRIVDEIAQWLRENENDLRSVFGV